MSEAVVLDFTNCKFVIKCSIVANKIATAVLPVVREKKKKKVRGSNPSKARKFFQLKDVESIRISLKYP
jgi:hypothetical protein